jgi:hypothetical protein
MPLISRIDQAAIALRILGRQVHRAHQALDLLAVDPVPLIFEPIPNASAAVERVLQVTAIDQRHQCELLVGDRLGYVIERRARQTQQRTLPRHR